MFLNKNISSNQFKSFVYENKIINPTFTSTTSWSPNYSSISASNNVLTVTGVGTDSGPTVFQNIGAVILSRKYYALCTAKVTNSVCSGLYFGTQPDGGGTSQYFEIKLTPTQDTLYTLKGVVTVPTNNLGNLRIRIFHNYASSAASNGKIMELQNFMVVDLTGLYGAGNEPTAADCANIFTFVDGTKQSNFSKQIAT